MAKIEKKESVPATKKRKILPGRIPLDIELVNHALKEDAPEGDITTDSIIPDNELCRANLVAKEDMVICGLDLFAAVFRRVDPKVDSKNLVKEGDFVKAGTVVAQLSGPVRAILTGERVALNFIQRLSGVATLTRKYCTAVEGTGCVILDTRKTTPLYRDLEKYAVRCGGAENHRRDLSSAVLIKENHIRIAGSIESAVRDVRNNLGERKFVEVEVESLDQIEEALDAKVNRIMLDNMLPAKIKKGVALIGGRAETEASGGIKLSNIRAYAKTGVNYISVGALTHSPQSADLSLLII